MTTVLERAADFMWNQARLLERTLFAYHFGDGSREAVLAALRAYQNPDGGFGNALEPDKRCPDSQPIDIEMAFQVLDAIDAFNDPLVLRACDYLVTITTSAGGVPFSLPTANAYPHQPWWEVEVHPPAEINTTAGIVGLLLKHGVAHPWVETASAFCWHVVKGPLSDHYHELMPTSVFLTHIGDRERAETVLARIVVHIQEQGLVAYDPEAPGYVQKPLDWAPESEHSYRCLFTDAVLATHLDVLRNRQQEDGGWPITWEALSPGAEAEWRGVVTLRALRTLRAYDALT